LAMVKFATATPDCVYLNSGAAVRLPTIVITVSLDTVVPTPLINNRAAHVRVAQPSNDLTHQAVSHTKVTSEVNLPRAGRIPFAHSNDLTLGEPSRPGTTRGDHVCDVGAPRVKPQMIRVAANRVVAAMACVISG